MDQTLRILVTDDEAGMRDGAVRVLGNFSSRFDELDTKVSYTVETAGSGEEALEIIGRQRPDLLLLDYKLPGISGLDVLAQTQVNPRDMITVMITAYASLETAITATKQGAFDFLTKPFTPQELRVAVRKATSQLLLLREAQRLADEKRRIRFEFISVLSHELKAPLNAVESHLNLIQENVASGGDAKALAHSVARSLARIQGMRKLIFDLIDMTRIESGTMARNLAENDLVEIARGSLETQAPIAAERRISLALDAPAPVAAVCDRGELEIVLNNLVSNAVKYNRDGGSVRVRLRRDESAARIEVEDTGIGLSEAEVARLFADFVRIKNEKTRHIEGSGLGLSTLKKIAGLYGGEISVRSEPDVGSTFTFVLPQAAASG
ncbi:MAG TPA: ATP-binding protein [Candidatus Krumholzibacteria bacterium]|nr:ATP-binding protein [Candidatus Krumholzibacteria bacterium]HPD73366.1 ATP-binding protein [Candidatus Krumholzibacteria bacterium]HRY42113.1 ATP-binding protein [Candidatus Krumholzibacteria bacterium]